MSVTVTTKGDFKKTRRWLDRLEHYEITRVLNKFGEIAVQRLNELTPKRTGKTAESWYYEIHEGTDAVSISFHNSNINEGQLIALLIQEGHGTKRGHYVPGRPYIDEALNPVYKELFSTVWKEVTTK